MKIIKADFRHIPLIAPLLDQYRVFYKQTSNINAAIGFLEKRFTEGESILFLAFERDRAIGFTQLYTSFSSVSLESIFILNDLYVNDNHRGKKVGEKLLAQAKAYCLEKGYKGLALETSINNPAQQLYERLGWEKDTNSFHYFWTSK